MVASHSKLTCGDWFILACIVLTLGLIAYGMHSHMPLAISDCVPDSPNYERAQAANKDCAAFDRLFATLGGFVDR